MGEESLVTTTHTKAQPSFDHTEVSEKQRSDLKSLGQIFSEAHRTIERNVPDERHRAKAGEKLEEAWMHAKAGIENSVGSSR